MGEPRASLGFLSLHAMFFLDEDLSPRIATIAREQGLDVLSTHESGRNGLDDEEQLRFAAQEGRILVTCNRDADG